MRVQTRVLIAVVAATWLWPATALAKRGAPTAVPPVFWLGVEYRRVHSLTESERAVAKVEASKYTKRGVFMARIGVPVALASVGFLFASAGKNEPAWRLLPFALLIFYVMLQFVAV